MAEEFQESEILFPVDSNSGQTFLSSEHYNVSDTQNGILFYYSLNQVEDDDYPDSNRRQIYRQSRGSEENKAKSRGSAPIDIPAVPVTGRGGGRVRNRSRREREFEDYLPPHEILARRRFADDRLTPSPSL